ncbi:MAG: NAD+ synthase [Alphaproteobacteria bacterium]|nr:MAG: NAD+ synthase [Alphaproteobacteria bacterium]
MSDRLAIAIAQTNPVVGDIAGNLDRIRRARAEAGQGGADLVVFSELVLLGYPPEDLVLKPAFQQRAEKAVRILAKETADGGPAVILGSCWADDGGVYNASFLLADGEIAAVRYKYDLPNYGVFDEKRVFRPGPLPEPMVLPLKGGGLVRLGVMICEDLWSENVAEHLARWGADIFVVINGSPFEDTKFSARYGHAEARVRENGIPLIYVNQVGGQDELVFDGASFVLGRDGTPRFLAPSWAEDVAVTHWEYRPHEGWTCAGSTLAPAPEGHEAIYQAMMLGLRDYVNKNGFPGVLLGMSGGIDSAVSAAVAVDALGPERVRGVMMPSRFTSAGSLNDSAEMARLMGFLYDNIPIEPAVETFADMLSGVFAGTTPDTTEENIQARIRGVILMALSNKFGHMLLTTGNKSEMSVGYATLYGDMAGGYSVLKDIYKTEVYALARWRNQNRPAGALGPDGRVIPEHVITRAPSAELRADQTDQDTLPDYAVLDDILYCLVEEDMSVDEIAARGHAPEVVERVEKMLYVAEYKRRQAPPGVKITRRTFGRDRRYPITNRFRTTQQPIE